MHGNRETSEPLTPNDGGVGRTVKAASRTTVANGSEESDGLIVPKKRTNKSLGPPGDAEPVEGSGSTKGNALEPKAYRTPSRKRESLGLQGVRYTAKHGGKDVRFTTLLHHVNVELLRQGFYALKRKAKPGVDGQTWQMYETELEVRLLDLHGRIHRGSYRPKPSRRVYIPKGDGRERPLGIASLEDKIVQRAVKTVLECIYEADFKAFSYGFRPGRRQHDALDALSVGMYRRKVNWVLDADIRGFFDHLDHGWLMKFMEHRLADRRVLALIQKWLDAGVLEDGEWSRAEAGAPQGSVISPILSNVFLHYVLDLWIERWRKKEATGDVIVVRYADDFVVGFQHEQDGQRCLSALKSRLDQFGLALHEQKTRLIEFGRYASTRRRSRGESKPETFDFLGFTHQCSVSRRGWFDIRRTTIAKRMRATLSRIKQKLRQRMHQPIETQGRWLRRVIQGWFNYHGIPGNQDMLDRFQTEIGRMWLRVLRRRSQRGRCGWNWSRMRKRIRYWFPKVRSYHPYPLQRLHV